MGASPQLDLFIQAFPFHLKSSYSHGFGWCASAPRCYCWRCDEMRLSVSPFAFPRLFSLPRCMKAAGKRWGDPLPCLEGWDDPRVPRRVFGRKLPL